MSLPRASRIMEFTPLFPFQNDAERLERYCKLPLHIGVGRVASHGDPNHPLAQLYEHLRGLSGQTALNLAELRFDARFLMPATGNLLIILRGSAEDRLPHNFGEGLTVTGNSPEGPFELHCPRYYVKA